MKPLIFQSFKYLFLNFFFKISFQRFLFKIYLLFERTGFSSHEIHNTLIYLSNPSKINERTTKDFY